MSTSGPGRYRQENFPEGPGLGTFSNSPKPFWIMPTSPPESPAGFEAAMAALEQLVARMEAGDLPLEESLREYQRGMELIRACQDALDEAQRRIDSVIEDSGTPPSGSSDRNDSTNVPDIADPDNVPF
jgi:exodeoxyribonuclease VII small subunit